MKKPLLKTALLALTISGTLLILYFIFYLNPQVKSYNALVSLRQNATENYLILAESRLLFVSLANMDFQDRNFVLAKDELLSSLKQNFDKAPTGPLDKIKLSKKYSSYHRDLSDLLISKNYLVEQEKVIVASILSLDSILAKIFIYDYDNDLGSLETSDNIQESIDRLNSAVVGLTNISNQLKDYVAVEQVGNPQVANLINELAITIVLFEENVRLLEQGSIEMYDNNKSGLSDQYRTLKQASYFTLISPIRTQESVTLLTEHSNLLIELRDYINSLTGILSKSS